MGSSAMPKAPPQSRCPKCQQPESARIVDTYEHGGVVYDGSYCGRCGSNWPKPVAVATTKADRE